MRYFRKEENITMLRKTSLNQVHHDLKARMIDFGGWELPVWYTSILEEHKAVRSKVGIFDISHMGRVVVTGRDAGVFLGRILTRPPQKLDVGQAHYCLMCQEDGGIIDDLWVYRLDTQRYLIIWNASHTEDKLTWISYWANGYKDVNINDLSASTVMVAVQGPFACWLESLRNIFDMPRFGCAETDIENISVFAARTGYTGEDGFEIFTNAANALALWQIFIEGNVKPCGLGARDSLRLEAGYMLYGADINRHTNAIEARLMWVVDLKNGDFIGKDSILNIKNQGVRRKVVGFMMIGRGIARPSYKITLAGEEIGEVTSGGYSPTIDASIGIGYVPTELAKVDTEVEIVIRGKPVAARIVDKRGMHPVRTGLRNKL